MIGIVSFLLFFAVKAITTMRFSSFVGGELPSQVIYACALIGFILIFNSVVHTLTFYDTDGFSSFKARKIKKVKFSSELLYILKGKEFWLRTLPVILLAIPVSLWGGFFEVGYVIFEVGKAPLWARKLLPVVTVPLLLFLTALFCRYEIHRYYCVLIKRGEEYRVESKVKMGLKILVIALMYPLIFPYAPYLIFMIITFFGIVGALIGALTVVGFIAAAVGLVFGVYGLGKLKVSRTRAKFISEVTRTAAEKGESIRAFTKEERAVRGYDFTLTSAGRTYSVKILTALNGFTPLYFNSANDAHFLHRLGTKNHNTSIEKHFEYSFVGEGQRLIVLIKFPRNVFAAEYGAVRRLYSGDRIWNYVIFRTDAFLGAQDRECLHRSNEDNR